MDGAMEIKPAQDDAHIFQFDRDFTDFRVGDIVLVAIDAQPKASFCFRYSLLESVSQMLNILPAPVILDNPNGPNALRVYAVHDITVKALALLLAATQSIGSPQPFVLGKRFTGRDHYRVIMDAVVAAKTYQMPTIYRVLVEGLRSEDGEGKQPKPRDCYAEFCIWAIAGVNDLLPDLARLTLGPTQPHITQVNRAIIDACIAHAPDAWRALQDLHLRFTHAMTRLYSRLEDGTIHRASLAHPGCDEGDIEVAGLVCGRISDCETVEEVMALSARGFDLDCEMCKTEAGRRHGQLVDWLEDFALKYIRDDETDN